MAHAPMAFRAMLLSFNGYKLIFCAFKLSPTTFSCVWLWPTKARSALKLSFFSIQSAKPIPGALFGRLNALASPSSFLLLVADLLHRQQCLTFHQLPNYFFCCLFPEHPRQRKPSIKTMTAIPPFKFQRSIPPSTSALQVGFH